MHVLFFVTRVKENGGGSHKNIAEIANFLRTQGHEVTLEPLYPAAEGFSFSRLQSYIVQRLRTLSENADVCFLYGHVFLWAAGKFRKRGGHVPVVVYVDNYLDSMALSDRGQSRFRSFKLRAWEKIFGLRSITAIDTVCYVSPYLKGKYLEHGFPDKRCEIIPNLFTLPHVVRQTVPGRVLAVGRFVKDKGMDVLIEALSATTLPYEAHIIGDGPERENLSRRIEEKGLSNKIRLYQWMEQSGLSKEYGEAEIYVHSARWPEPFGRTIVEAMHAGVPVVVPEEGAAAWVAGAGGATFKNGDTASLQASIVSLLEDVQLRNSLSKRVEERSMEFDAETIGSRLIQVLKRVS